MGDVIGGAIWLVLVWLGFAFITVPLTLLATFSGLVYGVTLSVIGYLRVYRGAEDETALARADSEASRRVSSPYPRWDNGWPNYMYLQVERDLLAAALWSAGQAHDLCAEGLSQLKSYKEVLLFLLPAAPAPFAFIAGVLAGTYCAWAVLAAAVEVIAFLPRGARITAIYALRAIDFSLRWWHGAAVTCPECHFVERMPAYQCCGDECNAVHHDLRPGRLGVWKRRCGCGAQLPTTVTRAARILMPACVNCERPLPESAGVMSDARIVISGGPAVGKTHLLLQAVAEMYRPDLLSPWEPADDQTAARLRDMDALAIRPLATSAEPIAASTTLMLRRTGNGWPHYLHIVDLDGRYFQTGMENSALWQLGETRRHLLVIDATVVPWVRDRIFSAAPHSEPSYPAWIETGVAAAELPYRLLVMQLNRMGARTRQCSLALVITKADVLAAYGVAPDLNVDEHSAEGLRAWLRKVELHNLVAASEHDFAEVRCFVMGDGREAPSAPFYWLMDQYPHGMSRP